MRSDPLAVFFAIGRKAALGIAAGWIVGVALVDWLVVANVSLGFLYVLAIVLAAGHLSRLQILLLSAGCALLREQFSPFAWEHELGARITLVTLAYLGTGLFVKELARNRQLVVEHLGQIQRQVKLRREAEEQLKVLIASSPAAILTVDSAGDVLLANEAAQNMLGFERESLSGQPIRRFFPILADVLASGGAATPYRTAMQFAARRRDGEVFFAFAWFSTYRTDSGPQLAAIVVDASEELRDREQLSLQQVLATNRILVGAVSHEIRNLCGAVAIVHANLARVAALETNEDFRALSTLVEGLSKLASAELQPAPADPAVPVDLRELFDEFRVITGPSFEESDAALELDLPDALPLVWADRQGLLQVFMNLAANSRRALEQVSERRLSVAALPGAGRVTVRFLDSGPGVADPELLFKPFQPGAGVGLGLYVSRALVRSFRGDLRHEPRPAGCCFALELEAVTTQEDPA